MAAPRAGETEVYFITPKRDTCYNYAIQTRVYHSPDYSTTKYFTTNPLKYAGIFLRREFDADGNGADIKDLFEQPDDTVFTLEHKYDAPIRYVHTLCQFGGKRKYRRGTKKAKRSRRKTRRHH